MTPLDPVETSAKQNESPMAPPYVDDNDAVDLTKMGMDVAENEKRDTITAGYEKQALASGQPEEALDDIDYPKGGNAPASPEISAMREDFPPNAE